MTIDEPMGYDELDGICRRLQLVVAAAYLHGSLCGFLACGGQTDGNSMLAILHLDEGEATRLQAGDQTILDSLVQQSGADLADPELSFEPFLPADDRPLSERAEALQDWCRGFLGGFGLAGANRYAKLSEQAQELLRDLGMISGAAFDFGDATEDEDALIELHEFVRMAAMLLYAECVLGRDRARGDTVH